jgi:DNA-binding IclR family transcriptional regulator
MDAIGVQEPKQGTQTATRSLRVLWLLAESTEPLTLREIVERLEITRSAAHRLMAEFARQELVTKTADHRYHIGPAMVALAARVLQDDRRVCVDTVESVHPIRRVIPLGQTLPLYVGPTSKAILAYLPEADQARILARAGEHGHDIPEVRRQLAHVITHGYLAAIGDRIAGVGGLSFALLRERVPVASVTISGPADRWSLEAMEAALPAVRRACAHLRSWTASVNIATGTPAAEPIEVSAHV